jgi:hypothetical protein
MSVRNVVSGFSPTRAVSLTLWWTRLYTFGLPVAVREARRAEIESDLWESLHDPDVAHPQILPRLAAGIVDDVCWRAAHLPNESRTMWLSTVTAFLLIAAMWQWLARPAVTKFISESIWLYPIAESSHVLAIVLFLGLTVMLDLRLLGLTLRNVPVSEIVSHVLPWAVPGGVIAVVSGMLAFLADPERFTVNVLFQVKAAALVLAVLNLLVFHVAVYSRVSEWDLLPKPPLAARLSAVFSLALWAVVVVTGRLVAYNWFAR